MVKITKPDGSTIEVTAKELLKIESNPELFKQLFGEKVEGSEVKRDLVKQKTLGEVLEEFRGRNVSVKNMKEYSSRASVMLSTLAKNGNIKRIDWGVYFVPMNFSAQVVKEVFYSGFSNFYKRIKEKGKRIGAEKKFRSTYEAWAERDIYYLIRFDRNGRIVRYNKFTSSEVENPLSYDKSKRSFLNILIKIINNTGYKTSPVLN